MSRLRILAANWKMNNSISSLDHYFTSLKSLLSDSFTKKVKVVLALPYTHLYEAQRLKKIHSLPVDIASQNVYWESNGAYTGEISLSMLKELGVTYSIVGHSERRQYFFENDESVSLKVESCIKNDVIPILCVGESLEERKAGLLEKIVEKQIKVGLSKITDLSNVVVAYEPVWAIGTGISANSSQAQEAHAFIRNILRNIFTKDLAQSVSILYGGSMKPANTKELILNPDIDGGLVGGASLDASSFCEMIQMATANE